MKTFLPWDCTSLLQLLPVVCTLIIGGYYLPHLKNKSFSRAVCWLVAIASTFAAHYLTRDEVPGFRMLAIITVLFISMKIIVANEYSIKAKPLSLFQWMAYAIGWFGMNPQVFTRKDFNKRKQGIQLIKLGASRIAIGLILCFVSWILTRVDISPNWLQIILVTVFLLSGLSMILHFGILNINSGIWNLQGYGTYALFRTPLQSLSLKEFWGKRWNFAFSEMTSIAVHRPLKTIVDNRIAMIAAFAFSGLLHELAISIPVHKGYGLPSLYFIIQALSMFIEGRIPFKSNSQKHAWVLFWLIIPMPVLFNTYFLSEIIWPIIGYTPFIEVYPPS